MALTENQLDTQFQSQLGRAPTPYEVSVYSNASPQELANLKNTYSGYNTSQSIVDYLKYTGQDPSTMAELAKEYGISGIGTAAGNTALLAALKSGKKPSTTPVTRAVAPAPAATDVDTTVTPTQTPAAQTTPATNTPATSTPTTATTTPAVGGSISAAAGSTTDTSQTTPNPTPDLTSSDPNDPVTLAKGVVDQAYEAQQEAQQAVASIDATLNAVKSERMASIAAEGGVVDEAALTSEIYAENQPLLQQRQLLVAAYTAANSNYQKAVSDYNDTVNTTQKSAELEQGQEKINDTANYQQGELALKAAGLDNGQWKAEQVSQYQDGQVVGKQWVAINASTGEIQSLTGSGASVQTNGSGTPNASSGASAPSSTVGGVNLGPTSSGMGAYAQDPNYSTEVSTIYSGIQSSGLNFQTPTDINSYIASKASNSPISGNDILVAARQYGIDPVLLASILQQESNFGTTGAGAKTMNPGNVGNTGSATKSFDSWQDGVNAVAQNLQKRVDYGDPDMNLAYSLATGEMAPSEASKRAASYTNVLNDANTISEQLYGSPYSAGTSDADYKYASAPATQNTLNYLASLVGVDGKSGNLADLVTQSNALTRTQFPALNNTAAWARLEAGDPQMAAYNTTLTEVSDQVAKILQGGGSGGTSDSKLQAAQELFSAGFNKEQIISIASDLQGLLGNRAAALIGTNPFLKNMYSGLSVLSDATGGANSFSPRGSTDANTFVAQTFATLYPGQTEAQVQSQYKSDLQPGEQLAFDNNTGAIVAVNPKTDDMSQYTPL